MPRGSQKHAVQVQVQVVAEQPVQTLNNQFRHTDDEVARREKKPLASLDLFVTPLPPGMESVTCSNVEVNRAAIFDWKQNSQLAIMKLMVIMNRRKLYPTKSVFYLFDMAKSNHNQLFSEIKFVVVLLWTKQNDKAMFEQLMDTMDPYTINRVLIYAFSIGGDNLEFFAELMELVSAMIPTSEVFAKIMEEGLHCENNFTTFFNSFTVEQFTNFIVNRYLPTCQSQQGLFKLIEHAIALKSPQLVIYIVNHVPIKCDDTTVEKLMHASTLFTQFMQKKMPELNELIDRIHILNSIVRMCSLGVYEIFRAKFESLVQIFDSIPGLEQDDDHPIKPIIDDCKKIISEKHAEMKAIEDAKDARDNLVKKAAEERHQKAAEAADYSMAECLAFYCSTEPAKGGKKGKKDKSPKKGKSMTLSTPQQSPQQKSLEHEQNCQLANERRVIEQQVADRKEAERLWEHDATQRAIAESEAAQRLWEREARQREAQQREARQREAQQREAQQREAEQREAQQREAAKYQLNSEKVISRFEKLFEKLFEPVLQTGPPLFSLFATQIGYTCGGGGGGWFESSLADQSDEGGGLGFDDVDTQQICSACDTVNNQWSKWVIAPNQIVFTVLEVRKRDFRSKKEFLRELRAELPDDVNVCSTKTASYIKWSYKQANGKVTFGPHDKSTLQMLEYCRVCGGDREEPH